MEDVWRGTETTDRDRLENMDWTEGHSDCRTGREEKSKSVEERSRETAEKTDTAEVEAGTRLKGQEREFLLQGFRSQGRGQYHR